MRQAFIITVLLLVASVVNAQERSLVRKGNEFYEQKKFAEAAASYQKALQQQPQFIPGAFNLGNALIQQKQFEAARKVMDNTAKTAKDPVVQGGAKYNAGNTYMSEQQWQQAVDAYKQSLRKNPGDADAQYNLSYALSKLKQQQNQNKDKKNKQQNQDKKDDKKEDKKDQQQPDKKEGDQKEQERPQPQPSKLSEQQADNLLKALQQDERKVQDKMQQGKASPVKMEKDW